MRNIKNIIVTTGIVLGLTFPILYAMVAFIPKGRGYISTLHFGKDIAREDAYIDDFSFKKGLFRKIDADDPGNFILNDGTEENELHGKYVTIDTRSFDIRDPVYSRGLYYALSNTQSTTIQDDSVIEVSCNPLTKDFDLPFFRKISNRFSRNPGYTHVIDFKCISFPIEEDVAIQDLRFDFYTIMHQDDAQPTSDYHIRLCIGETPVSLIYFNLLEKVDEEWITNSFNNWLCFYNN